VIEMYTYDVFEVELVTVAKFWNDRAASFSDDSFDVTPGIGVL
jgi:hypothetical protein